MLRLILRQILKHKWPLLILSCVWIGAGYFLYHNSHNMLALLVRLTVDLPEPGRQDPLSALGYVKDARERVRPIRLDLMQRTCTGFLPLRYTGSVEDFRPHWLEKLDNWQIQTESGPEPVEPDLYWRDNLEEVLASLRDAVNAMQYAYEITGTDQGDATLETTVVPDLVARLARAACRPELAMLAYGDYAHFQEERAWLRITGGKASAVARDRAGPAPILADLGPGERERLILEQLAGVPEYIRALRLYLGGPPVDPGDASACNGRIGAVGRMGNQDLRLGCVAPTEALSIYDRLLQVSPADDGPALHRDAGLVRLMAARRSGGKAAEAHREAAIQHLTIASGSYATEFDARVELARLYLAWATELEALGRSGEAARKYALGHDEVRQLALLSRRRDFRERDFRALARRTLMGLGRFRDADCFADMSSNRYGTREHCLNLAL
ncbi:MAG: hypothetical protein RIF32_11690 [Leptospirales bacterium]|jgi:hypothetical protein